MAERVQKDSILSRGRRTPTVEWKSPENGMPPPDSFIVKGCNIAEHAIALDTDSEGRPILKWFVADDTLRRDVKVLVIKDKDVEWKTLDSKGNLPPGAIRTRNQGKYGNIYVGRHPDKGVGMVVMPNMDKWVFCTGENNDKIAFGFSVLCYK